MRAHLALIALPALLVTLAPRPADACSIADDRAEPPAVERPYDPARGPATPVVVAAELYYSDDSAGCGVSSCGEIHGLSLEVQVDADTELLRIEYAGAMEPLYTYVYPSPSTGVAYVFVPGFADYDELELTVEALDADGYPSELVNATAYSEDDGGCSVGGDAPSAALIFGFAIVVGRVRRLRASR